MTGTNGRGRMCVFPVVGSPSLDCQETTDDPQAKGASTAQQQARERGTGLAATQCRRGLRGPYQSVASVSMGKAAKSIRRRRGSRFGGGGSDRDHVSPVPRLPPHPEAQDLQGAGGVLAGDRLPGGLRVGGWQARTFSTHTRESPFPQNLRSTPNLRSKVSSSIAFMFLIDMEIERSRRW